MNTEIQDGYLNPEQRPAAITPFAIGRWRDLATGTEREELHLRLANYEATLGESCGSDFSEHPADPPAIALLRERLQELNALEEKRQRIEYYKQCLKSPDLSLEHRSQIEAYLKKVTPLPDPPAPPVLNLQPVQDGKDWRVTIPNPGAGGGQVFKAPNLEQLVEKLAVAQYHATAKIRKLVKENRV